MPTVTICPPAPQTVHFDQHQFLKDRPKPVNGNNSIAWEDYERMNLHTRKQSNERKMPTPEWALDDEKLRKLLVRFVENRAGITLAVPGGLKERLDHAWRVLQGDGPRLQKIMDGLNAEYICCTDKKRRHELEVEIENCDTQLMLVAKGPGALLRMVHLYYRTRLDSVGVAGELGIKPPHVRTTLCRMNQFWKKMHTPAEAAKHVVRSIAHGKRYNLDLPSAVKPVGNAENLTGQRFDRLTVIGRYAIDAVGGEAQWLCVCNCGKKKVAPTGRLKHGLVRSCGCLRAEAARRNSGFKKVVKDITGQRFGRLVAVQKTNLRTPGGNALWICKCDCGNTKLASGTALRYGSPRSCGCGDREQNGKNVLHARKHTRTFLNAGQRLAQ